MARPDGRERQRLENARAALRAGRPREAAEAARAFARRFPADPDGWTALATSLHAAGAHGDAERAYRRLLGLRPELAEAHYNHGLVLAALERHDDAVAAFERAIERAPGMAAAYNNLGNALVELGRAEEAVRAFRRAAELRPDLADAPLNLGNALKSLGRFDDAAAAYRQALANDRTDARAWRQLASLKRFTADDPDLAAIERLAARRGLPDRSRAELGYALAKARDDLGDDPASVVAAYVHAAGRVRARLRYDIARDERLLADTAAVFDAGWIARHTETTGIADRRPVFVVGMPRSGTTLLERMLAAHAQVHGAGESRALQRVVAAAGREHGEAYPHWARQADAAGLERMARGYLEHMGAEAGAAARFTDKMPGNYLFLGLIAAVLPRARVLHLRRDPVDTCWSLFTHRFERGHHFSYDLAELGRYYRAYDALMAHWRRVLPDGLMLELDYEQLVRAPKATLARLLEHCDLDHDPACLEPAGAAGPVRTASAGQVRQRIHAGAVGRAARYRDHLGALLEALGPLAGGG